jgi:predicted Rossmann fold nucleotide-binding protein DprA/Smf involved in DNA uptake
MRMDSREAFIVLNMIEGVGPVRARSLLEHFGDASKILVASKSALLRVRNIGDDTAEKIASWEKSVDLAGELKRISDFGCHVLISADEDCPAMLREIYDPPLVNDVPICKKRDCPQKQLVFSFGFIGCDGDERTERRLSYRW